MPRRDPKATRPPAPGATVGISQSGRGGSITYREGENTVAFDWEFGASPAIALIFGANAQAWDRQYPWAAGRQGEIYAFVGAEAVRQQAEGAQVEVDLESGAISVLERAHAKGRRTAAAARPTQTAAYAR